MKGLFKCLLICCKPTFSESNSEEIAVPDLKEEQNRLDLKLSAEESKGENTTADKLNSAEFLPKRRRVPTICLIRPGEDTPEVLFSIVPDNLSEQSTSGTRQIARKKRHKAKTKTSPVSYEM